MQTLTFRATDEDFANPERGFFAVQEPVFSTNENVPLARERLDALREEGGTVMSTRYVMDDYRTRDLSQSFLELVEADFEVAREAGVKIIPKFSYVWNERINAQDAPLEWALHHIEQLEPVLREHAEVIDHVQGGFIGLWGEMHTSSEGHVLPRDVVLTDSGERIVTALLDAVPEERMVSLRYPQQIEAMALGEADPEDVFGGPGETRIGFFNDGFAYDETDFGTFSADASRRAEQEAFVEQATEYGVASGEPGGRDDEGFVFSVDAVARLDRLNFGSLSAEQSVAVADGVYEHWRDTGVYDDISRGLGYRFELERATLPEAVAAGGTLDLVLEMSNVGFSRPHNERPLEVVLRAEDGTEVRLATGVDARTWGEDEATVMTLSLALQDDLPASAYEVLLALPDPSTELADDPRYSIRLANEAVWEADTGLNALGATVIVGADARPTSDEAEPAEPEPTPPSSGDVRAYRFDADAGGQLVIEGFDVDRRGTERTYDTVAIAFEGGTLELRDGDDLLALMRELETDGAQRPDSDAMVSPAGDVGLRFDADTTLVLEGAADEFTSAELDAARVDYEPLM